MVKLYNYIGSPENLALIGYQQRRIKVTSLDAVRAWIAETGQELEHNILTVTFIVDATGKLWISDRRSEHVVCAAGGPVCSAGELAFEILDKFISLSSVTNLSTGFCPEPNSWPTVAKELVRIGLQVPNGFGPGFDFRRCAVCGTTNTVKEGWFFCAQCDSELDQEWNFYPRSTSRTP